MRSIIIFVIVLLFGFYSCDDATNEVQEKSNNPQPELEDFANEHSEAPELLEPADGATVFEEKPLFRWSEVESGGRMYQVEIHASDDMNAPAWSDNPEETSWRIVDDLAGLDHGRTYFWRVKKLNITSDWSEVRSFTVDLKSNQ